MTTDSKGNRYKEIDIHEAKIRVTYVEKGWNETQSVRIQTRDGNGHLLKGPEVPIDYVGDMVGAIVKLLAHREP